MRYFSTLFDTLSSDTDFDVNENPLIAILDFFTDNMFHYDDQDLTEFDFDFLAFDSEYEAIDIDDFDFDLLDFDRIFDSTDFPE